MDIEIGKSYWVQDGDAVPHKVVVVRESRTEPRWFMCRNDDMEFIAFPDAFLRPVSLVSRLLSLLGGRR